MEGYFWYFRDTAGRNGGRKRRLIRRLFDGFVPVTLWGPSPVRISAQPTERPEPERLLNRDDVADVGGWVFSILSFFSGALFALLTPPPLPFYCDLPPSTAATMEAILASSTVTAASSSLSSSRRCLLAGGGSGDRRSAGGARFSSSCTWTGATLRVGSSVSLGSQFTVSLAGRSSFFGGS